ncbi:MAG: FtsQ-type POTRA domain-containing protein [bacterium]
MQEKRHEEFSKVQENNNFTRKSKKNKKLFIYINLGAITFILLFLSILVSPKYYITSIEVDGLNLLSEGDIIKELNIESETHILSIGKKDLKERLATNYYVKDLSIERKFPSSIVINVKERIPIGYIPYVKQALTIDIDGVIIDINDEYDKDLSLDLPLIEGIYFKTFNLGEEIEVENINAFSVVMQITSIMYEKDILNNVIRLDISDINDIHIYVGEIDVVFGSAENVTIKINTLEEIIKNFTIDEKGYLYIDDVNTDPIFRYIT